MPVASLPPSGLSPRVRGNRARYPATPSLCRSIPACAGEPAVGYPGRLTQWVYPRVCGGTNLRSAVLLLIRGLSPRVRGNR